MGPNNSISKRSPATDDHEHLEQVEHGEDGDSLEDAEIGVDDELIELSNSDIEIEMESQFSLKKGPSEIFQMEKLKMDNPVTIVGSYLITNLT